MLAGLGALKSQIKVVSKLETDCDQTKGASAAQTMLTANQNLTAIYSACGPPALGAIQSIKNAGIKCGGIILVGFDGLADEVKAVKAGCESATVAQHPDQDRVARHRDALLRGARQKGAEERRHWHRAHHEGERQVVLRTRVSRRSPPRRETRTPPVLVDTHQHFWNPARIPQPWITDEYAAIARAFEPPDLEPLLPTAASDGPSSSRARRATRTRTTCSRSQAPSTWVGASSAGAGSTTRLLHGATRRATGPPEAPRDPAPHPPGAGRALDPRPAVAAGPRPARGQRAPARAPRRVPRPSRRHPDPRAHAIPA